MSYSYAESEDIPPHTVHGHTGRTPGREVLIRRRNSNLSKAKRRGMACSPTHSEVQTSDVPSRGVKPDYGHRDEKKHGRAGARGREPGSSGPSLGNTGRRARVFFTEMPESRQPSQRLVPVIRHPGPARGTNSGASDLKEGCLIFRGKALWPLEINQHGVSGNLIPRGRANKLKPLVGKNCPIEHSTQQPAEPKLVF